MNNDALLELGSRIGEAHLRKRLSRQVNLAARFYAKGGYASFHPEHVEMLPLVLETGLKLLGLYQRGLKNAMDYRIELVDVALENLPPAFDGFRILQLTDIHADGIPDDGSKLIRLLKTLAVDLCVITGDFRFLTQDAYRTALDKTAELVAAVDSPNGLWGILGNHDFIEFVPGLEAGGIRMLLNEAVKIRRNGEAIWLSGIDDAHLYDCHDIGKAIAGIPPGSVNVMLSHTPETYAEASRAGVDYLLCGHTHGGQLCLPGGIPIITNARCPRRFCAGAWQYGTMKGYTSRATGSSGLPVRFNCPPEVTIHRLVGNRKRGT